MAGMAHVVGGAGEADPSSFPRQVLDDGTVLRLLGPDEGAALGEAIQVAYGDSYDAAWVYDASEVGRRIAGGQLVSAVAETSDGELLCHAAASLFEDDPHVAEVGQAVTLPAARGHHLFTEVKRHLADWGTHAGLFGFFSEATTAHPYSERANVELGAKEAGFLLGWIPATVDNDAATPGRAGRQSAALFYLPLNDGHDWPLHVPARHREVVADIVEACGLRGAVLTDPPAVAPPGESGVHLAVREDHNLAVLTVERPGADLATVVDRERRRLFEDLGLDVLYVDLPMERGETVRAAEDLEQHGVTFAGVFPNGRVAGDVLRLQVLNGVQVKADDISTASDHGAELLAYVLADLERHGQAPRS
jgi:serine/threonine-protein kinase RsbW